MPKATPEQKAWISGYDAAKDHVLDILSAGIASAVAANVHAARQRFETEQARFASAYTLTNFAEDLADLLTVDNRDFDRRRFLEACETHAPIIAGGDLYRRYLTIDEL